jgi:hypothetical protein
VGELCWLWNYGLLHNRPCGCGTPLRDCAFWTAVGEHAFGGWDTLDVTALNQDRQALVRTSRVRALWSEPPGRLADQIKHYRDVLSRLYAGIAAVSGAAVVVDSSKQAAAALLARRSPRVDLRLIHLLRSPHGVAYSWTKRVARADLGGGQMRRRTPVRTALRWHADAALFERMAVAGDPRRVVRYEDFVASPDATTRALLAFAGQPADRVDFVGPSWVDLSADHSVWGNPMRARLGRQQLRLDSAWQSELPARDRRVVSMLTWPTARKYGYARDTG